MDLVDSEQRADNPETQFCYFNTTNDEQVFNQFISKRINSEKSTNEHLFEIVEVVSKFNKNIKFNTTNKLKELDNGTKTSRTSETYFDGAREKEQATMELNQLLTTTKTTTYPLSETMKSLEKELNLDIFLRDKDLKKQNKKV